jgi:hypothetical protein
MLKSINDIIVLKKSVCDVGKGTPFGAYDNEYEHYIDALFDCYISKLDGIERIKCDLRKWDLEAKEIIIKDLLKIINSNHVKDFNEREFLKSIIE